MSIQIHYLKNDGTWRGCKSVLSWSNEMMFLVTLNPVYHFAFVRWGYGSYLIMLGWKEPNIVKITALLFPWTWNVHAVRFAHTLHLWLFIRWYFHLPRHIFISHFWVRELLFSEQFLWLLSRRCIWVLCPIEVAEIQEFNILTPFPTLFFNFFSGGDEDFQGIYHVYCKAFLLYSLCFCCTCMNRSCECWITVLSIFMPCGICTVPTWMTFTWWNRHKNSFILYKLLERMRHYHLLSPQLKLTYLFFSRYIFFHVNLYMYWTAILSSSMP